MSNKSLGQIGISSETTYQTVFRALVTGSEIGDLWDSNFDMSRDVGAYVRASIVNS